MWQVISNIASIATCILFVFYLIGHYWKSINKSNMMYEQFRMIKIDDDDFEKEYDNELIIDEIGEMFLISTSFGIRGLKVIRLIYNDGCKEFIEKKQVARFGKLNPLEQLFIQCDLGEVLPTTEIVMERPDYVRATFLIRSSGKTGNIVVQKAEYKRTIVSFFYYLFVGP